jgi:uncharacterized membrane protein
MAKVGKSIEIDVPVHAAYNQWTQFETFPEFMSGVKQVRQLDDTHLHWKAEVAGKDEEWDAEITQQLPDQEIAWRSTTGAPNSGMVSFEPISDNKSRVTLQLEAEPQTLTEKAGDALGMLDRQVKNDLERFRKFIENRGGQSTGAWRGQVT